MSTQEVFVQQFARLFQHYQQALDPISQENADPEPRNWNALAADDRNRMMAAARLAILEMETNSRLHG